MQIILLGLSKEASTLAAATGGGGGVENCYHWEGGCDREKYGPEDDHWWPFDQNE